MQERLGAETLGKYINLGDAIKKFAVANQIDTQGLIKSEEQIQQETQQAQQQQFAQQSLADPRVAIEMGKQLANSNVSASVDDEGNVQLNKENKIMSTDRVEINPDNNNKTLEQSQEDLAKQGVNVNESVVNNNGESVNISQPENITQSSEQQVRPNWLPEKFKSAEELAKAYGELEKKMSAPQQEEQPTESVEENTTT